MALSYCGVFGCTNKSKTMPHLSYFSLPKDDERRKKWIELIDRNDIMKKKNRRLLVCSTHFTKDMFKNKRLKPDAVPSLNLPESEVLSCRSSSNENLDTKVDKPVIVEMVQVMGRNKSAYQCIKKRKRKNNDALRKATQARLALLAVRKYQSEKKPKEEHELALAPATTSDCMHTKCSISDDDMSLESNLQVAPEGGPSESNEQELGMKIKNSLKQLRRQSTGETDNEDPTLHMEVFPDQPDNPKTEENPDTGNEENKLTLEFHDESEPVDLPNLKQNRVKKPKQEPKNINVPAKPLKRNPRRQVQIEKEIQESIKAAESAPALEKVYVGSLRKLLEKPIEKTKPKTAKKARLEPLETHFSHTEKLYEFGKFVAEQMMCFDETDVSLAQAEIKEVLTKFRLKYKIMKLLKPNEKPDTDAERQPESPLVTQANSTAQTKPMQKKTYKKTVTVSAPRVYANVNANNSSSQVTAPISSVTLGSQTSQVNPAAFSMTQNGSQMTARSFSTPSGSQVNTTGTLTSNGSPVIAGLSGLPQLVSVVPSLKELNMLTPSSSATTLGFVVVPTSSGFQLSSQHINAGVIGQPVALQRSTTKAIGPSVPQAGSSNVISTRPLVTQQEMNSAIGNSVTQPGSSCAISTRPLVIQPEMNSAVKTSVTQPESYIISTMPLVTQPNVNSAIGSSLTEPGSSHITSTGSESQAGISSESSGPPFKMPPTHFIDVIPVNEPESLIVKCEMESDEET